MQIWSEVTQQNCHHRCQSLWPWSTDTENLLRETVPSFVSGWQTHKKPALGYCRSIYLRGKRAIPKTSILQPCLSLLCYPQVLWVPVWCSGYLPTFGWHGDHYDSFCSLYNNTLFKIVQHYMGCLLNCLLHSHSSLQSMPPMNSPHPQTGWIKIKREERNFQLFALQG